MDEDWKLPWEGGCRCGAVRLRVTQPPLLCSACHCEGCQRMTSSAYALSLTLHTEGFEVIAGEPVLGGLRGSVKHYHCPACLSWMFTRPDDVPWLVNLRPTMLDHHAWVRPLLDVHRREGFGWAQTGAKHVFQHQPAPDGWPELMREYAAEATRP